MALFNAIKKKLERWEEEERRKATALSEKELMVEILIQLKRINHSIRTK